MCIHRSHSDAGDFQSALPYCQQSCEAVGVIYGSQSVELAYEKEKLSQLLFHRLVNLFHLHCGQNISSCTDCSGCYDSALKTAQEALQLLCIYRGEHHQGNKELEETMRVLST